MKNPEETYKKITEDVRARVVEMWEGLRKMQDRSPDEDIKGHEHPVSAKHP
jgi:hypothetical protein